MGAFISLSESPFHGSLGRSRYPGEWDDQQVMSPTRVRFTPASGALSGVDTWFYYYRALNNLLSAGGVSQIGVKTAAVATFDGFNWNDHRAVNPVIVNNFPGAPAPVAGGTYNDFRAVVYNNKVRLFISIYDNPEGSNNNRTAIFESVNGLTFVYVGEATMAGGDLGRTIGAIANVGGTLVSLVSIANGAGGGNGRQKWISTDGGMTWLDRGLAIPVGTEGDWNGLTYLGGTMELIGDYYVALLHGMPFIGYSSGTTPHRDWPEAFGAFRCHVDDILTADVIWEPNAQNPLFIAGPTHGATWHAALYQHNGSTFAHMETWGVPGFGNIGNATNMALRDTPYFGAESRVSSAQIYMLEMKDRGWLDNWTMPILADGDYTLRHVASGRAGKFVGIVSSAPVPVINDEGEIAKFAVDRQFSYYRFRSGDVAMRAPSEFPGAAVVMEVSPGELTNQAGQWDLTPWGDPVPGGGRQVVITNRYTRMALSLANNTEEDGSPLVCLPFTGDPAQVFEIMPYRPSSTTSEWPDPENGMVNLPIGTGDIVTTTEPQNLDNKTLELAGHTGTIAQLITYAAAGDFDTLPDNSVVWAGGYPFVKQDGAAYDRLPVGFIPRIPSPFAFRAVCNGVVEVVGGEAVLTSGTDDTAAIRALHDYCNAAGVEPDYTGVGQIAIQADAQIEIRKGCSWNGAAFHLIGGMVETLDITNPQKTFIITDPDCPVIEGTATVSDANLDAGSVTPTADFFDGPGYCLMIASATGPQISDRQRTVTVPYKQSFAVLKSGKAVLPLSRSMAGTVTVDYKIRRMSAGGRAVVGDCCLDPTKFNNLQFLTIERNAVTVRNIVVLGPDGEAMLECANRLFRHEQVAFTEFENIIAQALGDGITSRSSYVFSGREVAETRFTGVIANGPGWGATGYADVNGQYYNDCHLNRYDVHGGAHNIFVVGGSMLGYGIAYGQGGGVISVIGTHVVDSPAIYHRPDEGGAFYGQFIVDGISGSNRAFDWVVVDLETNPIGSAVISTPAPNVSVTRVRRVDVGSGTCRVSPVRMLVRSDAMEVVAPAMVKIGDIGAGQAWHMSNAIAFKDMAQTVGGARAEVDIFNCNGMRGNLLSYLNAGFATFFVPAATLAVPVAGASFNLRISNSDDVAVDATNSSAVRAYYSDIALLANYMADNCIYDMKGVRFGAPLIKSPLTSAPVGGALTSGTFNFGTIVGGRVEASASAWDFSNVQAISGVLIASANTSCVYPTGATREQMFSGWTPEMCGQVVMIRQTADRTLTATTSAQAIFDEGGKTKVALAVGIYTFELPHRLTDMEGAAASNFRFDLKGAGTATLAQVHYQSIGRDVADATSSSGTLTGIMSDTAGSLNLYNNIASAGAGGVIRGEFEVTVAGTIQPSFLLSVAAAATVKAGTSFRCTKIASASVAGPWSA